MSDLLALSKEELVEMVQAFELQLKDLYLEKRLASLDRDQLIELIGRLEDQHGETVSSLSAQLSELYAAKSGEAEENPAEEEEDHAPNLYSLRKAA